MINEMMSQFDGKTFDSRFVLIQEASVEKEKALFVRWHSLISKYFQKKKKTVALLKQFFLMASRRCS